MNEEAIQFLHQLYIDRELNSDSFSPLYLSDIFRQNYNKFTIEEIIFLSETLNTKIPISFLLNNDSNNGNNNNNLNGIKKFLINQNISSNDHFLSLMFILMSNLFDSVKNLTNQVKILTEENQQTKKEQY